MTSLKPCTILFKPLQFLGVCVGASFHMRGLPPRQAAFKEEQQVAAGRGNLGLSGCQSGIAAESRLFI